MGGFFQEVARQFDNAVADFRKKWEIPPPLGQAADVWHPLPPAGGEGLKKQIPKCPKIGYHPPLPADGVKRGAFDRRKNNWFTEFFIVADGSGRR